jgi:MFS family permease
MDRRATIVLVACFFTVFAAYAIRYSYGTLLPEMLISLDITKAQAGVIYSSYFIAYTILSPVMGILSDRYDMRIMVSVFVALMGGGAFLMQYSYSVIQASLFFTIAGIGCAACWAPVMAVAQRWASSGRRGMVLAFVDAGSTLGVMAAGFLVPLSIAGSSWRTGWMLLGILGLILGAVDFVAIRSYPPSSNGAETLSRKKSARPVGPNYKKLFEDKRFWLIGLAYLLTGFAVMVPFTFISTYAIQERVFSFSSAAGLVTIIGAGGLVGKLVLGPISDKLGRIKIMLLCALLIAAGCGGIAFSQGWLLYLMAAIFGIGYGACWSMYAACASDFFSPKAAGGIIGIWTFYLGIGLLTSPIIAGWIGDSRGTLIGSFILAAATGIVSFILLLPMLNPKNGVKLSTSLVGKEQDERV